MAGVLINAMRWMVLLIMPMRNILLNARPYRAVRVSHERIMIGQILMDNAGWDMELLGPSSFLCNLSFDRLNFKHAAFLTPSSSPTFNFFRNFIDKFPQMSMLRNSVHLLNEKLKKKIKIDSASFPLDIYKFEWKLKLLNISSGSMLIEKPICWWSVWARGKWQLATHVQTRIVEATYLHSIYRIVPTQKCVKHFLIGTVALLLPCALPVCIEWKSKLKKWIPTHRSVPHSSRMEQFCEKLLLSISFASIFLLFFPFKFETQSNPYPSFDPLAFARTVLRSGNALKSTLPFDVVYFYCINVKYLSTWIVVSGYLFLRVDVLHSNEILSPGRSSNTYFADMSHWCCTVAASSNPKHSEKPHTLSIEIGLWWASIKDVWMPKPNKPRPQCAHREIYHVFSFRYERIHG